jgi:hypothetical protein
MNEQELNNHVVMNNLDNELSDEALDRIACEEVMPLNTANGWCSDSIVDLKPTNS